jgi:hypothetical protein
LDLISGTLHALPIEAITLFTQLHEVSFCSGKLSLKFEHFSYLSRLGRWHAAASVIVWVGSYVRAAEGQQRRQATPTHNMATPARRFDGKRSGAIPNENGSYLGGAITGDRLKSQRRMAG